MREWSSGTQTDFTNYAARRLAERGLLREDDPIKLQRAVTEIAYSYARGGASASGYVPNESPLGPSRPLPEAMGWATPLRSEFEAYAPGNGEALTTHQTERNDAFIAARQSAARAQVGRPIQDDVSRLAERTQQQSSDVIEHGRSQVSKGGVELSGDYRSTVRVGKISRNHGGNQAVWDTVGANSTSPDLGNETKPGGKARP